MEPTKRRWSRRNFLASGTAVTFLPARVLGLQGALPPSEKLNLAFIGLGTYGARGLQELAAHNVTAVCDVDWRTRAQLGGRHALASEVAAKHPQARRFDDWRRMLGEMEKQIDGVVIASADHAHAHAAITAMKAGKHVFCEKPLAYTVHEVRAMMAAERRYKVATQTGTQGHASEDCRALVEWLRDGVIGTVKEVHLFQVARPGEYYFTSFEEQTQALAQTRESPAAPPEVKWDLWLGPAPHRPFHPMYTPRRWRNWLDFGTGILGDHGPHFLDPILWALDLGFPESIEAETNPEWDPEKNRHTYPYWEIVRYSFPARGKRPALTLTWHGFHDPPLPPGWKTGEELPSGGGVLFGSKGSILFGPMYSGRPREVVPGLVRLFPEDLDKQYRRPAPTLARPASHWLEWVEAAKTRRPASAHFAYGGLLTQICLLGDIAIRHKGKILRFEAKSEKFTNSDSTNRMFQRPYREGWALPS